MLLFNLTIQQTWAFAGNENLAKSGDVVFRYVFSDLFLLQYALIESSDSELRARFHIILQKKCRS